MRRLLVLLVFLAGCDDEALYYANGEEWQNVSLPPSRIPPSQMNARQFADWAAAARAAPRQDVKSFAPSSYVGFSVDPTQEVEYIDLGSQALLYFPATLFGTSNATTFELSGVPEIVRPTATVEFVFWGLDNGNTVLARATISSIGNMTFTPVAVSGAFLQPSGSWTNSGNKGVKIGTFFLYPK